MKPPMEAPSSPGKGPVQLRDCIEDLLCFTLRCHIDGELDLRLSNQLCSSLLQPISHHSDSSSAAAQHPPYTRLAMSLYESLTSGQVHAVQDSMDHSAGSAELLHQVEWTEAVYQIASELENVLRIITFELHVQEPLFTQLKEGLKTIEGRCDVGDYKRISPSSLILFNKCLVMEVLKIDHYDSFSEMLKAEGLAKVLPGVQTLEEGVQVYRKFYTEEKEMSNGVLAIHVRNPSHEALIVADCPFQIKRLGCEGIEGLLRAS